MDLQLVADEEDQDRAKCGKDQTGRMVSFIRRPRKHVRHGSPEDRPDNAEHDRPEYRDVLVHDRFGDDSGD